MTKNKSQYAGYGVSGGIAIGRVHLLTTKVKNFPKYWIHAGEVKIETLRFRAALTACREQINQLKSKICQIQGGEQMSILDSHMLLVNDDLLVRNTVNSIKTDLINAEWALHKTLADIRGVFLRMSHAYFRDRESDINDVENALLKCLLGKGIWKEDSIPQNRVIVSEELSPADIIKLAKYRIAGLVMEGGGIHSHAAIIAHSLHVPAVISVKKIKGMVKDGDLVVVDGDSGLVYVRPTKARQQTFLNRKKKYFKKENLIQKEAKKKAVTLDGREICIMANMELLDETDHIIENGADGIGLFRTEFLFMRREGPPSEKEQQTIYRALINKMKGKEVTIRTFDISADKLPYGGDYPEQDNPALGLRALRYCLRENSLFRAQLKALLLASRAGPIKICLPMVSCVEELREVKKILESIKSELGESGKYRSSFRYSLGVMIETPAAAIECDLLCVESDFLSVGTNDLVQYLLAVDRNNDLVSHLYSASHPSVIRTLKRITDTSKSYSRSVTVCGEMAADPLYLKMLIGLGFDELSMSPASIPRIKKMIRNFKYQDCMALVVKLLSCATQKEITKVIQESSRFDASSS